MTSSHPYAFYPILPAMCEIEKTLPYYSSLSQRKINHKKSLTRVSSFILHFTYNMGICGLSYSKQTQEAIRSSKKKSLLNSTLSTLIESTNASCSTNNWFICQFTSQFFHKWHLHPLYKHTQPKVSLFARLKIEAFLSFISCKPLCYFFFVKFSAFHLIYIIIYLTVFVLYCLLLLPLTILLIQPSGFERDINKLWWFYRITFQFTICSESCSNAADIA